jgi:hypothetical protein
MSKLFGILLIGVTTLTLSAAGCSDRTDQQQSQKSTDSSVAANNGASTPGSMGRAPAPAPDGSSPGNTPPPPGNAAGGTAPGTGDMSADAGNPPGAPAGPDQSGNGADGEQYSADLHKCDAMKGADKTRCIDAVKRKHGEM